MQTVGFVGLGAMGTPMARNLLKAGFRVRGYDVRASAVDNLVREGGLAAATVAEAAKGADALVLMVVNAQQAESVLFEAGALDALSPNGIVIVTATCPADAVADIAKRVLATGRRFVDAPVSGGTAGATAGSLSIMVGAPKASLEAARPILEAMGKNVYHVGEQPGQGALAKCINQLLCGVHIAACAEAMSLAKSVGVDVPVMLEIVSGSAASSWMVKDRGPRMLREEPEVTSAVDIFVKDLDIVLSAGRSNKVALPLSAAAHQMFLAASGAGLGAADDSQVIRAYDALNTRKKK